MSVFDHAMQMELDGKKYYEEAMDNIEAPELKTILQDLARDEQKHYLIFKAMRDGEKAEYVDSEATDIFASMKNVFVQLKEANKDYAFDETAKSVWEHAREIEKKSEHYYRTEADKLEDKAQAEILHKIADEEHKHWVTMENIINFLDRPTTWLEDAEWSNLEDY